MSNVPIISPNLPNSAIVRELVKEKFANTTIYADEAFDRAMLAIDDIVILLKNISDIDTHITIDSLNLEPSIDLKSLIRNAPVNPITQADYDAIEDAKPRNVFQYNETDYISALLDGLRTKVTTIMQGGGSGLGIIAEDAMFHREDERDALALQDAKDKTASDWAERNFELPGNGLFSEFTRVQTEYMNARLVKSRAITVETRNIEIENVRQAMKDAIAIETVLMDYKGKQWDRKLQAAKAILEEALAIFNAAIEILKTKASVYGEVVRAFAAEMEAIVSTAQAEIAIIKGKVDYAIAKANTSIATMNAKIDILKAKYGISLEGLKGIGSISSQVAASALSAVSASAHMQVGESQSLSAGISAEEKWTHQQEI